MSSLQPVNLGGINYFGIPLIVIGGGMYLWCGWDFSFAGRGTPAAFDPPKKLVVRGLYRYVRNPMYVGILSILLGEALLFGSLRMLVYAVIFFSLFFSFVVFYEEPTLRRKFGKDYLDYCKNVPRWIPLRIRQNRF